MHLEVKPKDLASVVEAVKIRLVGQSKIDYKENFHFKQSGNLHYSVSVRFEIIGCYLDWKRIKVVVLLHEFSSSDVLFDYAIKSLKSRMLRFIVSRIPETNGVTDVILIKKERLLSAGE